jgi:hypothetical protein
MLRSLGLKPRPGRHRLPPLHSDPPHIEQLIHSRTQAPPGQADRARKRRMLAVIESNPRLAAEAGPQALFQAAAYPEAIAAVATAYAGRERSS